MSRSTGSGRLRIIGRLARRPMAVISFAVIVVITGACVFAPLVAPHDPLATDFNALLSTPTWQHLLGTDGLGRDILSRLVYGGRVALLSTAIAAVTAVLLGLVIGLTAGYLGGRVESTFMRFVDGLQAIPQMILLLVTLAVFPNNLFTAMLCLGVLLSAVVARVVRSAAVAVRSELYVDAARVGGLGSARIMVRHILPRVLGPLIVQGSLLFAASVIITSSLGFLGLGVRRPEPSWGSMIAAAAPLVQQAPWQLVPVGVTITLLVLALGVFGDVLRDVIADKWAGVSSTPTKRTRDSTTRSALRVAASTELSASTEPDGSALLSVRDLRISFDGSSGEVEVVHGVSFDVSAGEILGVVGESGSGKTATVRSLIGLLRGSGSVTGGGVWFRKTRLTGLSESQLAKYRGAQIGFIAQEPTASLDPSFRAGDQIAEAVRRHERCGRAAARRRAIELLRLVKIDQPERVARLYPHQISGGMAQRVSIARALSGNPSLLIADEPTSALDVTVQSEILSLLASLCDELGMAVLLITHDFNVVESICHRALVMYAGVIVEQAPVDELLRDPKHPYTRGLKAADPRNAPRAGMLPSIPGVVPKPSELPVGCNFQDRCPLVTDECRLGPIQLIDVGEGRHSRCIHWSLNEGSPEIAVKVGER